MRTKADSPTKTCTLDGCDRALRARGLCATHYNQAHQPDRHRKVTVPCSCCGTPTEKEVTGKFAARFCSQLCHDFTYWGPRHSTLPATHPVWWGTATPLPADHPAIWWTGEAKSSRLYLPACTWCGDLFASRWPTAILCSRRCSRRLHKAARRGREAGASGSYTWAEVMRLFIELGRCCGYCPRPIEGQPDPDHVVPLSRGGSNSITNIVPACRECNSAKSWLLLDEWQQRRIERGLPRIRTEFAHLTWAYTSAA